MGRVESSKRCLMCDLLQHSPADVWVESSKRCVVCDVLQHSPADVWVELSRVRDV